ncbi:MAG: TonB-dependent receptor [Bacteroidetes bacterium]|nr:TonB-dependent receptor [Bacteroidota bacterium]
MKYKLYLLLIGSLLFCSAELMASGKIRGSIVDEKTKEALVGASVVVVGTNYGAVTDIDGNYIILNLPVATYSLRVSFLGYQNVIINNIKVNDDLTSEVNFNLTSTEVQLNEVVIIQDRPLVNKNATNAVRIGTQEDIQKLPVRGVQQAVVLSAGVVLQNGNLYIRGGRNDEVGYYVEGASSRSVVDGTNLTTIIPEALEEFQVQAGGYTAEYGGANAGIVRQSLRAGSQEYKVSIQAETDNFTDQFERKFGTYSYGYSNYVMTVGGPLPGVSNVKFFVAGENQFQRDVEVRFWDGFTMKNLPNSKPDALFNGVDKVVPLLEIKPGNIPGQLRNRYTTNGTLTFDFNPIIVRLGGSFSHQREQKNTDPITNIYNMSRLGITENSNLLLNAKLTHILSSATSYDLNFSYLDDRNKTYDPYYGDNILLYADSIENTKHGFAFRNYYTDPASYELYDFTFDKPGEVQTNYTKGKQDKVGVSFDITSQVNSEHQLKLGASIEQYTVRNFTQGGIGLLGYYRSNPDDARTPGERRDVLVASNAGGNFYGYDMYGNEIDDADNIDGPKTPRYIGAYIQDKLEYSDLVVNAGIRLDYIDNDDIKFVDDPTTPGVIEGPDNPSVDNSVAASYPMVLATGIAKSDPFVGISPRLGFSFPVSDKTVFHLQWGKFLQAPRLNLIYRGRGSQATIFSGGNFISNPVGYNIQPTRTTQYEVGFTQQFTENAAFDITGFYKDIQGQIQIKRIATTPQATASGYNSYVNGDFVTTKGVELTLRLRRINRLRAQINYTYSDAQGTGSSPGAAVSSVENGTLYPSIISPLDFNQTHRGSINLDYAFGKDDGGPVLEQFGMNMLISFNSGHPFTRSSGSIGQQDAQTGALVENDARNSNPLEAINSSTTPWNSNLDLRMYKGFDIAGVTAEIYCYVQNLLNTKNVINVYRRTGNAYDDGFLSNPELSASIVAGNGPGYEELYRNANLRNGMHYRNVALNNLFGTPRQIRFGMRLEL